MSAQRKKIFISYRRDDDAGSAGRMYDYLAHEFGSDRIFKDVYNLEAGADYRFELDKAIAESAAMLVLIGPRWLMDGRVSAGLAQEITTALMSKIFVLPVLLDDARMPPEAALPQTIRELCYRQAASVRNEQFHLGIDSLVSALGANGISPETGEQNVPPRSRRTTRKPESDPQTVSVRHVEPPITESPAERVRPSSAAAGVITDGVIRQHIETGHGPQTPLVAHGSVWVSNRTAGTVSIVDPATRSIRATVTVGKEPGRPVAVGGRIWVPNSRSGSLSIIPATETAVVDTVVGLGTRVGEPAIIDGQLWVPISDSGTILVVDTNNGSVVSEIDVGKRPSTPVHSGGSVWISSYVGDKISVVNLNDLEDVRYLELGRGPEAPVAIGSEMWVPVPTRNRVFVIDRETLAIKAEVRASRWPLTPVALGGRAHIVNARSDSMSIVDLRTFKTIREVSLRGGFPGQATVWNGRICVPSRKGTDLAILDDTDGEPGYVTVGVSPGTPTSNDGSLWVPVGGSGGVVVLDAIDSAESP